MKPLRPGRAWCVVPPAGAETSVDWLASTEDYAWAIAEYAGRENDEAKLRAAGWRVVRVRIVPEEARDA
jgi:hypothetical protein